MADGLLFMAKIARILLGAAILVACFYGFGAVFSWWDAELFGNQQIGGVVVGLLFFSVIGLGLFPWETNNSDSRRENRVAAEPVKPLEPVPYWTLPDDEAWDLADARETGVVRTLGQEEVQRLFDKLANCPQINWKVLDRNCEARTDMMCETARDEGLQMGKIWASAEPFEILSQVEGMKKILGTSIDKAGTECANWNFHVAATSPVETAGGAPCVMVFDPALFSSPVSVSIWSERLAGVHDGVCIVQSEQECYHSPHIGNHTLERTLNRQERNSVLRQSFNIDNERTQRSYLKTLRAEFVDHLSLDAREALKLHLTRLPFQQWWFLDLPDLEIATSLTRRDLYYHLQTREICAGLNAEDEFLFGHQLRLQYWIEVGFFLNILHEHLRDLRSGKGPADLCQEVKEAFEAKICGETVPLLETWYEPFSHELWDRFGLNHQCLLA